MKLTLYKPPFHTWMLALQSKNQDELKKFIRVCRLYRFKRQLEGWVSEWQFFWQIGSYPRPDGSYEDYQGFEFFGFPGDEGQVLTIAEEIAKEMGTELVLL